MAKFSASSPLDSLLDLACRDGVDIRPTLLRVLTDLYVQKPTHSADEETQYVELALGLIAGTDGPTRDAVRARLASYPAAPAAVLQKLTDSRTHRQDVNTAEIAGDSQDLADLFFAAMPEERRLILVNLDASATNTPGRLPTSASEVSRRLEAAALQRNAGEFGRILERALGISRGMADRVVRDPSGEPLVVAARAVGMKAAVLQRVLLFLNPAIGQSVQQVYDLARLFDDVTPQAAERMVAIWRDSAARRRTSHAPQLWDDERHSARSLATPAPHHASKARNDERPQRKTGDGS